MISTNFQFLFWQNLHYCADNGSIFIPTSWIIFHRGGCSPPSPFRPIARAVLNYSVQAGFISSMQRLAHCNFRIYRCAWQTTVTQAGAPSITIVHRNYKEWVDTSFFYLSESLSYIFISAPSFGQSWCHSNLQPGCHLWHGPDQF